MRIAVAAASPGGSRRSWARIAPSSRRSSRWSPSATTRTPRSRSRSARMLGVMAGVVLGIGVVAVAGVSTSAVILLLVVGLAIGLFLRTGPELNTQIAISALLVLVVTEDADTYAVERIWETARRLGRLAASWPPSSSRPTRWPRASAGWPRRRGRSRPTSPTRRARSRAAIRRRAPCSHARTSTRAPPAAPSRICRRRCARCAWSPLRRGHRPQLEVVDRRQRLALRLAIQVRRLARDLASFAHRDDLRDEWDEAGPAPAADHRGRRRRPPPRRWPARAARTRSPSARELHRGVPARGQPSRRRDPAPAARAARATSSRGRSA